MPAWKRHSPENIKSRESYGSGSLESGTTRSVSYTLAILSPVIRSSKLYIKRAIIKIDHFTLHSRGGADEAGAPLCPGPQGTCVYFRSGIRPADHTFPHTFSPIWGPFLPPGGAAHGFLGRSFVLNCSPSKYVLVSQSPQGKDPQITAVSSSSSSSLSNPSVTPQ